MGLAAACCDRTGYRFAGLRNTANGSFAVVSVYGWTAVFHDRRKRAEWQAFGRELLAQIRLDVLVERTPTTSLPQRQMLGAISAAQLSCSFNQQPQ